MECNQDYTKVQRWVFEERNSYGFCIRCCFGTINPSNKNKNKIEQPGNETMRWLPLTSLRVGRFEELNKCVLSLWDLKQELL